MQGGRGGNLECIRIHFSYHEDPASLVQGKISVDGNIQSPNISKIGNICENAAEVNKQGRERGEMREEQEQDGGCK